MLEALAADIAGVVYRTLVLVSFVCCAFILLSFTMFGRDQLAGASANQQNAIATSTPVTPAVAPMVTHHGQPRRFIDGVAHALTSPFSSVVQSNNAWVVHGVPTFFGLVVYGFLLGFLARYSRGTA
jgi:hypothetical protein